MAEHASPIELGKFSCWIRNKHEKPKVMFNTHAKECEFKVGNETLGTVTDYIYFKPVARADPNHENEITPADKHEMGCSW